MIDFPKTTYFGKRMPKEKFYSHLDVSATIKRSFVDDIDYFIWRNKLAETTINISQGKNIKEIAVLEVFLKKENYNKEVFNIIDRNIPLYVVYLLRFSNRIKLRISYKEPIPNKPGTFKILETYETNFIDEEDIELKIEGLNLDRVFEGFVLQIAGEKLQEIEKVDIVEAIETNKEKEKIEKKIAQLQNKLRNEKQFNKQIEISSEIKKLQKSL